jgi:hypothetical protein
LLDRLSSTGDGVSDAAGAVWDGAADVAKDAGNFLSQANKDYALVERGFGALTVAGGAAEIALGTVGILAPEPLTTAAGLVGAAHGIDTTLAGLEQIRTGELQQTVTEQLVTSGAQSLGASDATAENIGLGVDIGVSLLNPANLARHGVRAGAEGLGKESAQRVATGSADEITTKLSATLGNSIPDDALRIPKSLGAAAVITTRSRIKDNPYAVRLANKLGGSAQRDVDNLLSQLGAGNANPGKGTTALGGGFFELRGNNAGRVIVKQESAGSFDIVGKFQAHVRGDKANSATIQRLINDYKNL